MMTIMRAVLALQAGEPTDSKMTALDSQMQTTPLLPLPLPVLLLLLLLLMMMTMTMILML